MGGPSDLPEDWSAKPCIIKSYRRSRQIWKEVYGDPGPLSVLHRCYENNCWEVSHFYLGTKSNNTKDSYDNGQRSPVYLPGVREKISASLKGRIVGPRKSPGPSGPITEGRRQAIIEGKRRTADRGLGEEVEAEVWLNA